jgi:hypothetical protein
LGQLTLFSSLYGTRLDEELGTDDRTELFNLERRKSAINRGMREFAELTECFVRWSTLVMTGGTAEYDLNVASTDFVRLAATPIEFAYTDAAGNVTVLAGQDDLPHRSIKWLDDNEPGWRTSTTASSVQQMPQLTYERIDGSAHYLGFWPTPSTGSSASIQARVPYIANPAPMLSDTNEPFGSDRSDLRVWDQAHVHFAAHQLEKLRRDRDASQEQMNKFLGYVARYTQNTRKKGGNVIAVVRNYFRTRRNPIEDDPRT